MKTFNGSVTFADGRAMTFTNHQAGNEREMIKQLVNDRWNNSETIVSITVIEYKREEF
jgi:hypothetical protein